MRSFFAAATLTTVGFAGIAAGQMTLDASGVNMLGLTQGPGVGVVYPDGTVQTTAAGSDPVPGHGGVGNVVSGDLAFVGGGETNTASGAWTSISGGLSNTESGGYNVIGGGELNAMSHFYGFIGGGRANQIPIGAYGVIGGGSSNSVTDQWSTIGGGTLNVVGDNDEMPFDERGATVGGGMSNVATAFASTIAGGNNNAAQADFASIGGGGDNASEYGNVVTDEWGTIGGGRNNHAGDGTGADDDTPHATVGGGRDNVASATAATVSGGSENWAHGIASAVSGGNGNYATGSWSTVSGGYFNTAGGSRATVPGGSSNSAAGDYSFAAGRRAKISASHQGVFLFADSTDADFSSARDNEFAVRATGGVRFITNTAGTTGAVLTAGDSSWGAPSSKALKENREAIDSVEILEQLARLSIEKWNYIDNDDSAKHIGPYAEDFHAAFGLNGEFNGRITTQDFDGVALAAIQGLNAKLEEELAERDRLLAEKDAAIGELAARLTALEAAIAQGR